MAYRTRQFVSIVFHLGVFTPGILALVLTAWQRRHSGLRELAARLFRVDVPVRWYVFAVTYMAAAWITVTVLWIFAIYALVKMPRNARIR